MFHDRRLDKTIKAEFIPTLAKKAGFQSRVCNSICYHYPSKYKEHVSFNFIVLAIPLSQLTEHIFDTGGRKRDFQGGGKQEKLGKIKQHCAKFRNRKKRKEAGANKNRAETGI